MTKIFKRIIGAFLAVALFITLNNPIIASAMNVVEEQNNNFDLKLMCFLDSMENSVSKKGENDLLEDGGFAIYPDKPTIVDYRVVVASQYYCEDITVETVSCYYNSDFIILNDNDIDFKISGTENIDGKTYNKLVISNISIANKNFRNEFHLRFETPVGYSDIFSNFYCEIESDTDKYKDEDSTPGNALNNGEFDLSEDDAKAFLNSEQLQAYPYGLKCEEKNGTIKIVDYFGQDNLDTLYIPSKINGLEVSDIGEYAFQDKTSYFERVFVPSSVENIWPSAFLNYTESPSMKDVIISEGVSWIGSMSFYNCTNLKSINLPESVKTIKQAKISSNEYFSSFLSSGLYLYMEQPNPSIVEINVIKDSYAESYLRNINQPDGSESFSDLINYGEKIYTVHYDNSYNGGSWNAIETRPAKNGELVDLSLKATKPGWIFVGWNTNPNATTGLTSLKMGTKDVTLYAIFKKALTATFIDYTDYLKQTRSVTTTIYNNSIAGVVSAPVQGQYTGWSKRGWSTATDADADIASAYSISSDTTFYGMYQRTLTLNYNSNDGDSTPSSQTGTQYVNSYSISSTKDPSFTLAKAISKNGYYFSKWAINSTSGSQYNAGSELTISSNTTMYAVWCKIENIYNLGDETYSFANYDSCSSTCNGRGHCFGMSVTSSGYYIGSLSKTIIGGNDTSSLYSFTATSTVKKPICYYFKIQGPGAEYKSIVAGGSIDLNCVVNTESDWNDCINYVKSHKYDNKGNLQVGSWFNGGGGHAVNFLYYENVNGQDRIYVYDNNFPNTETYYYMGNDGYIYQAPMQTCSRGIKGLDLMDVNKYFSLAGEFNQSRYIYADKNEIIIENAEMYDMKCGAELGSYVMYEIPEDVNQIKVIPLVDNAEFDYLDETYSFGEITDKTVGVLTLPTKDGGETTGQPSFNIENQSKVNSVSVGDITLNYKKSANLNPTVTADEGAEYTVTYTSSNPSVARVDENGKVYGAKKGSADITVTVTDSYGNSVSDTCKVNVTYAWWQWIIVIVLFGWIWY